MLTAALVAGAEAATASESKTQPADREIAQTRPVADGAKGDKKKSPDKKTRMKRKKKKDSCGPSSCGPAQKKSS